GPDAQVDRHSIAPEDRMRVYVRRACAAHDIAGIVQSGSGGGEKPDRYRQLPNPGCVGGVIFPNDRKDIALTRNEAGIVNRARLACYLTVQGAEIGHLTPSQKEPIKKRADRAIADDVA